MPRLPPTVLRLPVLAVLAATLSAPAALSGKGENERVLPILARMTSVPAKQLFGHIGSPSAGNAQAIGFYALGCLSGAVELPATDPQTPPAWQVMRPSRNRAWGHPELIAFIEKLARDAKAAGEWNGLLVGDLSQPRGGPMLNGHASHQVGLDADVWLTPMPDRILTRSERENLQAKVMVKDHFTIDPSAWSDAQAKLIRRAAIDPAVQRIFVHPPIKKELCNWAKDGDRSWLGKVRPYFGHDYHFHIRLRCPDGSGSCRTQPEARPSDGTGCGDELKVWLSASFWSRHQPPAPAKVKPAPELKLSSLPAACRSIIATP